MAPEGRVDTDKRDRRTERTRCFRPDDPRRVRRRRSFQDGDVRGVGRTQPRLYRRRQPGDAIGDRGGIDPDRRHQGPARSLASLDRKRRETADCGVHRTLRRLRRRGAEDSRRARRRSLQDLWQQDVDHPRGACRHDDTPGTDECGPARLSRPLHVPCREATRHGQGTVPRARHERRRDRRAGISRHEGIRDRLRRFRSAGERLARARGRPGLQAADADLRGGAHPDRGARRRRGAVCHGPRRPLRAGPPAIRPGADRIPARAR